MAETPFIEIEKAFIACQCCGKGFWYNIENEIQDCPDCGCRNYRHTVMTVLKQVNKEV